MEGRIDRGRLYTRRPDGVKQACNERSLELSDAKVMHMDREQCRDFVSGTNGGMNA